MKLTMWRAVVVLNMYTKFREELSPSSFLRSMVPLYYVEKIKRALFAVAIWPVTGQGFQNTE